MAWGGGGVGVRLSLWLRNVMDLSGRVAASVKRDLDLCYQSEAGVLCACVPSAQCLL